MAAGLGFKTFATGEVLSAANVNGYLMQGILVFATEAARNAAITVPAEGQFAFTKDNNTTWFYDGAAWVVSGATGDITAVTAGTGISGGGASGDVTVTNSMATAIDAKGDLVPGTGADAFARLAVGANNTVLTADSAAATGMKWAAAGAPFSGVYCTKSVAQSITGATYTAVSFDVEVYDTDGYHDNLTNNQRLTVPSGKAGYYNIWWGIEAADGNQSNICALIKNGTFHSTNDFARNGQSGAGWSSMSFDLFLAVSDFIELRVYFGSTSNINSNAQNDRPTKFGMKFLGA